MGQKKKVVLVTVDDYIIIFSLFFLSSTFYYFTMRAIRTIRKYEQYEINNEKARKQKKGAN